MKGQYEDLNTLQEAKAYKNTEMLGGGDYTLFFIRTSNFEADPEHSFFFAILTWKCS